MRHQKTGRQLGRNSSHRKAMYRNMLVSLFEHESIKTTDTKAKELRRYAERLITLAKKGDLHARRRARVLINNKEVLSKLFDTIAPRYKDRPGGYTRIVKLGLRPGDSAPISVIQLVQEEVAPKKKKTAKKTTKAASKKAETKAEDSDVNKTAEVDAQAESAGTDESVAEDNTVEAAGDDSVEAAAEPEVAAEAGETPQDDVVAEEKVEEKE